jgi:cytidylate kinase
MSSGSAPVITLDGPSGSGKGTVGQLLAQRLGWHFLDSGALYRAVALAAERAGCVPQDTVCLAQIARKLTVQFQARGQAPVRVLVDGEDVSDAIREEKISRLASQVAVLPEVRRALLDKQHALRQPPGLVADGRDMGTVVFPEATLKIFVTATPETRAERRHKQLKDKGLDVNLARLAEEIRARDARDAERGASPLKPADDAHVIDTSCLTVAQVVDRILDLLRDRRLGQGRPEG